MGRTACTLFLAGLAIVALSGWGFVEEVRHHAWESKALFVIHSLGLVMMCLSPSLYLYAMITSLRDTFKTQSPANTDRPESRPSADQPGGDVAGGGRDR